LEATAMTEEQKEYRVYGPPGTGKTTYLARQLKVAAEQYGNDRIMVASFTRTAATEIGGRDTGIPKNQINTLHGHCFAALGKDRKVTESMTNEWNLFAPQYKMSEGGKHDLEDQAIDNNFATQGDEMYSKLQVLRAKMVPPEMWPQSVRFFADKWRDFKDETNTIDFTDMIEWCYHFVYEAPGSPSIGFFDETQDFTPLELALIRRWGKNMDRIILAGDDDQLLYGFKGATIEAFLYPDVPAEHKRVLSQSYRVPRAVLAYADRFVKQIGKREPKEYKPRDFEGEVRRLNAGSFKNVDPILADAKKYLDEGKSIMFLSACGYMLDTLKAALRAEGLPFHNPYRRKRYDWNPLQVNGTSATTRLLSFLRIDNDVFGKDAGMWTNDDMAIWTEHLKAKGLLKRGAKTALEQFMGKDPVDIARLYDFFEEDPLNTLFEIETTEQRIDWLVGNTLEAKKKPFEYPAKILLQHGLKAISEPPKIVIGSIHSVKGGEADVVYLFPDLSISGMKEYQHQEQKDGIIRQFYVGMTRARESLIFVNNCTPYKVRL
jgi:DNA helicase-2/ATP-dependent DNA helicase PcrA